MAIIDKIQHSGTNYDIGASAENVSYGNSNVKTALDAMAGGGSGESVPITNDDPLAYDLQRVFEKTFASEDVQPSANWQFYIPQYDCVSYGSHAIESNKPFKVVCEVQSSKGTLGSSGLSIAWGNFFGRLNAYSTLTHKYDGIKDIYSCTANSAYSGNYYYASTGATQIKIRNIEAGDTIKISIYVEYGSVRYFCRSLKFSKTGDNNSLTSLQYHLEWDGTATTVNKVRALIDNHMVPMVSASPEYDPFFKRNTTPRVLVTIVSDDGGINDYLKLHPMIKAKESAWNAENPEAPVHLRWSCAIPSNYPSWDENNRNTRSDGLGEAMTVRMVRELVADGVSILSHAYNHDYIMQNGVTVLNEVQLERIAVMSKIQLERMLGVPCIHYCLPGGGGGTDSTKAILEKYFLSMALTQQGINTQESNSYSINRVRCDRESGEDSAVPSPSRLAYITQAQEWVTNHNKSAWVVYYTHSQEWDKHHVTLEGIVDYCLANGIPLVNYSEAYAEMYPPIERLKTLLGLNS